MPRKRGAPAQHRPHPVALAALGEFGLIERLSAMLGKNTGADIIASIGDDAAVIRNGKNSILVFTTDALIETVHFDLRYDAPFDVGWKSIVANLSDIAAMNAAPRCAVVTLGIPKKISPEILFSLYKGIGAAAKKYHCPVVGGDTCLSPSRLFISVAMLGAAPRKSITLRSGATPGDIVCVTNDLGRVYAALRILQSNANKKKRIALPRALLQKYARPAPQFDILNKLRRARITPTAMIDISDGLSSELNHIAEQSSVRIAINNDAIPIHPATRRCAAALSESAVAWALQSGEEYELLFTAAPRHAKAIAAMRGVSVIGEVKKGNSVWIITGDGKTKKLPSAGYRHF